MDDQVRVASIIVGRLHAFEEDDVQDLVVLSCLSSLRNGYVNDMFRVALIILGGLLAIDEVDVQALVLL